MPYTAYVLPRKPPPPRENRTDRVLKIKFIDSKKNRRKNFVESSVLTGFKNQISNSTVEKLLFLHNRKCSTRIQITTYFALIEAKNNAIAYIHILHM